MEVLRLLKVLKIQPKHSLRVVLFMNEENGLRGAKKYASQAEQKNERHVFCLESDAGGLHLEDSHLIVRISFLKNLINGNLYLNHI